MAFNFENFIVLSLIKISTQLLLALEFLIQLRDFSCNQNVNVARLARNVTWDFFCDFQTLCTQKEMVQKRVPLLSFSPFNARRNSWHAKLAFSKSWNWAGSNFPPLLTYANHIMSCIREVLHTKNKVLMKMSFKIQKN